MDINCVYSIKIDLMRNIINDNLDENIFNAIDLKVELILSGRQLRIVNNL
jgi:hypothetical protein